MSYVPKRDDPGFIYWNRFASNGVTCNAGGFERIAGAWAYAGTYRKRFLAWLAGSPADMLGNSAATTTTRAYFAFRTGYYTDRVYVRALYYAEDGDALGGPSSIQKPRISASIGPINGALTDSWFYVERSSEALGTTELASATWRLSVTEDTEYELRMLCDNKVNLISACVYESVYDRSFVSADRKMNPSIAAVGNQITDLDLGRLGNAAHELRQRNRKVLCGYTQSINTAKTGGNFVNPGLSAQAAYTNLFDNSTTVTNATPGHLVNCTYDGTETDTSVNCKLAVYGESSDSNGTFQLRDSSGAITGTTVTLASGSAQWFTTTFTLTGAEHKIDPYAVASAGQTATVWAWWVWEHD